MTCPKCGQPDELYLCPYCGTVHDVPAITTGASNVTIFVPSSDSFREQEGGQA